MVTVAITPDQDVVTAEIFIAAPEPRPGLFESQQGSFRQACLNLIHAMS